MKKIFAIFLFVALFLNFLSAQQADTIIKNSAYESHYSFKYKNPIYVKYKLYQGGGNCNRSQFKFKIDTMFKNTASQKDYVYSGYDEGHLVNAEDFAYDCVKMGLTFKFYNCIPQTPNLNRGIWKSYETKIRKLSETDSLLIVCGGIFEDRQTEVSKLPVPTYCWKIVKSLTTGKVLYSLFFSNEIFLSNVKSMPIKSLIKRLGYNPLQ